jgi:hypothetical protein
MEVTIGRIVLYTLTDKDATEMNRRRTNGKDIADRIATTAWPIGAQAHIGSAVTVGQVFPMLVTRIVSQGIANGQVFLDSNDVLWAIGVQEGEGPGKWQWPPRV